jgi:hypothetical protein
MKLGSKITFLGTTLLAFLVLRTTSSATPINGTINFGGGGIAINTSSLATATAFNAISGVTVSGGLAGPSGSYAGTAGSAVTFTPFSFASSGVTPLWSFSLAGVLYSFNATSIIVSSQTSGFLNLTGAGTAFILGGSGGYSPTIGTWTITDTGTAGTFTFSASTSVPDGGSTALMIVLGLVAIGAAVVIQRRKAVLA